MRDAIHRLVNTVSEQESTTVRYSDFEGFFDIEEWLDRFIQTQPVPYRIQEVLKNRLPDWISQVHLSSLDGWEDFCRRRCSGDSLAVALLEIAKRLSTANPARAVQNLIDAWDCISDFFFDYGRLSTRICTKLFELDQEKGVELLFDSFLQQYARFPIRIVFHLDRIFDFADSMGSFDKVRLYEIWSSHNQHLVTGVTTNEVDLSWYDESSPLEFHQACLEYLTRLFDYPVVDVRLLALDELMRLTIERPDTISAILNSWPDLSCGQKEYVASLAFSISIQEITLAESSLPLLVDFTRKEQHRNLRSMVAEAVDVATSRGAEFTLETLAYARSLKLPPPIVVVRGPSLDMRALGNVWLPPYLRWSLEMIAEGSEAVDLEDRTKTALIRLYPDVERGIAEEIAVYRRYNINTNFDGIEIGGPYDSAARAALNCSVQMLVDSHELDQSGLEFVEDVLRLRDPSDVLVQKAQRPAEVRWIEETIADEDYLEFRDLEDIKSRFTSRDGNWVTIFEHTEQRSGYELKSDPQRATKVRVIAFSVPQSAPAPKLSDVQNEVGSGSLVPLRNRYRFELSGSLLPKGRNVVPIVVATSRSFRGRGMPDIAAFVPDLATRLSLVGARNDILGLVDCDRRMVVRSIDWQEAFDQGRRRYEPKSSGFLLQISRATLRSIAKSERLNIFASISLERTTDRYKPEHEMQWRKRDDIFPIEDSG